MRFAAVSGDRNPMHLDALLARRTQAGVPVVHGLHLLLWGLDTLARAEPHPAAMRRLKAHFKRFAGLDETVTLALGARTEASARLDFAAGGMTIAQLVVEFGASIRAAEEISGDPMPAPAEPRDLAFEAMEGLSGRLAFASPPDEVAAMFPAASAWLGPRRVAALAASTLLVGMVCPGPPLDLWRAHDGRLRRAGRRGPARVPGRRDSSRVSVRCGWRSRAAVWSGRSRATPARRQRRKHRRAICPLWSTQANSPAARRW